MVTEVPKEGQVERMAPPAELLEAPVKKTEVEAAPMTPEEGLRALEEEARGLGMSPGQLTKIRVIGRCPSQVQTRVAILRRWISSRLS